MARRPLGAEELSKLVTGPAEIRRNARMTVDRVSLVACVDLNEPEDAVEVFGSKL